MINFFFTKNDTIALAKNKGFSLIEVLVSLSIFTVVVTISVGSLLVLIDANARSRNMQEVMTNITYTLDSMTRDIRTGSDYYCSTGALPASEFARQDCASGAADNRTLSFNEGGQSLTNDVTGARIAYRLSGGEIQRGLGDSPNWVSVTSPNTVITRLRFQVQGSTAGTDTKPPRVTIYVSGYAKDDDSIPPASFDIQTTVTQQLLDI
jgi:prepilin-type N-terminal cleavage/methylation domain-containing protein